MKTILLTGATGFLGSHIAEILLKQGFKVIALKRAGSNLNRCNGFKNQIEWIECDHLNEIDSQIIHTKPEILIHAAWNGVKALDRDNWAEQEKNISFLVPLFEIVKKTNISKIIALGSQAEYGNFDSAVDENYNLNPNTAYGIAKVKASVLLKTFAEQNKVEWYWLRLFSIFGPKEDSGWLFPTAISHLIEQKKMPLTACEQKYDYLFTQDFASGILKVVECENNCSGIYNFSSNNSQKLKEILIDLEKRLSPNKKILLFGELPYRPNQVMHMQGNSDRFYETFKFQPTYSIYDGLNETIDYYLDKRITK